jgi:H+/Cl- antiporter ClcA
MNISGFWKTFLIGCFGGVMGEALNWYLRRESPRIAKYLKSARYWITTIIMILVGGLLAVLYGVEEKSAILVAHIGLTAPLIIKTLAQLPPEGTTRDLTDSPSIRDFIRGR